MFSPVAAANLLGHSVTGGYDLNGDGVYDYVIGAPGFDNNAGRVYIISGSDNKCLQVLSGGNGEELGYSLACVQSYNHDNYADIIIGVPGYNNNRGRIFIYSYFEGSGGKSGSNEGDRFGSSVSGGAYIDPLFLNDIVVGAPGGGHQW